MQLPPVLLPAERRAPVQHTYIPNKIQKCALMLAGACGNTILSGQLIHFVFTSKTFQYRFGSSVGLCWGLYFTLYCVECLNIWTLGLTIMLVCLLIVFFDIFYTCHRTLRLTNFLFSYMTTCEYYSWYTDGEQIRNPIRFLYYCQRTEKFWEILKEHHRFLFPLFSPRVIHFFHHFRERTNCKLGGGA